jgi:glycosyltransferase involved in cell wall biosynthesis
MLISIITPSFRSSKWLKLCIASVADQNVPLEHIVQDSCSDDGTGEWLPKDNRVKAFIEKDSGMYDAVNRGLKRAQGDLCAYLNCDEQYFPGALASVLDFFERNPAVDVVFADAVIVDPRGQYLCHRKAIIPGKYHSQISGNLAVLTCATFFRRRILDEQQLYFNPRHKSAGDAEWAIRLLKAKVRMAVMRQFTSAFTETGSNLDTLPAAMREKDEMALAAPAWARKLRTAIISHYRFRKFLAGGYRQSAFSYSIFTQTNPHVRSLFHVPNPTTRWRR